ncbi:eRF1 domain 1/Pelota-like protein [Artemisia annua]|uniref:ERF1 domain 1/Pelota-like protein n=1 Tax=Artemisia annua TaxID=35608 RepID=A0A2U1P379_ARTAN|nr:eRF1 domain 1/Pelota-like protein [Artemisia annua]
MADFHETDTNIARGKIMKLKEELKDEKGNGDSLLSIIVPPRDDDLSRVTRELRDFHRVTRELPCHESAIRAITSAQQKLQLYSKVPPHGLLIYSRTVVTNDGNTKDVSIDFEPFEPMHTSLCLLDNKFNMEGLSELLEYEDNYVRENERNIAIWKIKQLMKALKYEKGNGNILISLVMESGEEIFEVTKMLDNRFGTASSINMSAIDFHETDTNIARGKIMKLKEELKDEKGNGDSLLSIIVPPRDDDLSRVTRELRDFHRVTRELPCHESAIRAITSAQQKLQLYSKVPPHGLLIYSRTVVTNDGNTKDVSIDFEPFEPMHTSLCLLDNKFNMEGLSELLEYEDNYVRENERNIAIWKIKQLMKALKYEKGNGNILISLVMESGEEIFEVTKMLDNRFGTASSINMSAIDKGKRARSRKILKRYSKVPPNGLVIYNGTVVTDDGKEKEVTIEFEPFKPIGIDDSLCLLHHMFHIESLTGLSEPEPKYGFIVMVDNRALFRILSGNRKKVLDEFIVETNRCEYLENMVNLATKFYINDYTISALVVAVSPTHQHDLTGRLDSCLQKKLMCVVEVSYGGNLGFDETIAPSSNYLYNVRFIQEICLLKKFMKEIRQETILIVWENLDINRYVLKVTTTSELVTKHLNKEQETDQSNFRDSGTNVELEVQEKTSLID